MGVFKNDVGRPTNETIKKRRILKAILALLVAGALFTGGYYVNEFINKYDVNKEKENESKKEEVSLDEAEKIMTRVFGEDYNWSLLYSFGTSINDSKIKTVWAINNSEKSNEYTCKKLYGNNLGEYNSLLNNKYFDEYDSCAEEIYLYDDVNKVYKSHFGNKQSALKETLNLSNQFLYSYEYFAKEKLYSKVTHIGGDGGVFPVGGVISSYKENNKVYVTVAYGLSVYDFENTYDLELVDGTIIKLKEEELENKETYKKYQDKLEKYEFIFFEEDGLYKFEKVDKISKEVLENTNSKELDINSEEVTNLFNVYNKFNTDRDLSFIYTPGFTYFYNQDKVYMKDIDESLKFAIIYDEYFENKFKEDYAYAEHKVYLTDLNKISNKLFSTSLDIKKVIDKDNYINVFGCSQLKYNEKDQSIVVTQDGCGDCALAKFDTKIMSAVKSENKIEIVNKIMFLYESGCDPEELKIFKTATNDYNNKSGFKNEIADLTNKNISLENVKIDDYLDKLDSYKWTFVKNSEGNYIFESVEKIK